MLLVLFVTASSQTLLTKQKTLTHFLAANGLKRISIVASDPGNDPFLQNLYMTFSAQFYTRLVPIVSDHREVSQEDFYVFTSNSILRNLSAMMNMVSKTKVLSFFK